MCNNDERVKNLSENKEENKSDERRIKLLEFLGAYSEICSVVVSKKPILATIKKIEERKKADN